MVTGQNGKIMALHAFKWQEGNKQHLMYQKQSVLQNQNPLGLQ